MYFACLFGCLFVCLFISSKRQTFFLKIANFLFVFCFTMYTKTHVYTFFIHFLLSKFTRKLIHVIFYRYIIILFKVRLIDLTKLKVWNIKSTGCKERYRDKKLSFWQKPVTFVNNIQCFVQIKMKIKNLRKCHGYNTNVFINQFRKKPKISPGSWIK